MDKIILLSFFVGFSLFFNALISGYDFDFTFQNLEQEQNEFIDIENFSSQEKNLNKNQVAQVHIFTDFLCQFCQDFPNQFSILQKTNPKKIEFKIHYLPIFSESSEKFAASKICAEEQNIFPEVVEIIFSKPIEERKKINLNNFLENLENVDQKKFSVCLESEETKQKIEAEKKIAENLKIEGVPSFLIGEKKFSGKIPMENFGLEIRKLVTYN